MIPERARPFPNILRRLFSWYGRKRVLGRRSMLTLALRVSLVKSYSARSGKSSSIHLHTWNQGVCCVDRHAGRKDNLEPLLERFQVILTNFEGHHLRVDLLFFVVKLLVKIEDVVRNLWFALPILALRLLWRTCKGWLRGKWRHDSFWCAGLVSLENVWDDRTCVHFNHYQK